MTYVIVRGNTTKAPTNYARWKCYRQRGFWGGVAMEKLSRSPKITETTPAGLKKKTEKEHSEICGEIHCKISWEIQRREPCYAKSFWYWVECQHLRSWTIHHNCWPYANWSPFNTRWQPTCLPARWLKNIEFLTNVISNWLVDRISS